MPSQEVKEIFEAMGLVAPTDVEGGLAVEDPSCGEIIARVAQDDREAAMAKVAAAHAAFLRLREVPGPVRGELVRRIGERLRQHKEPLARLVTAEMGKGIAEALGEVQEMIDICDFATGLSRSLGGRTMLSERPGHRMFEQWHPVGSVLCITAFNFPVAVWAWNAALAFVCGDPVVWKPSLKTPLTAMATHALLQPVLAEAGHGDAMQLVIGPDVEVAQALVDDPRFPLVSATGSCAMGRKVGPRVAARLGRTLLELGGNNAIIVDATADLDLAARAIAFGAAGTAGQRCTTTRRLLVAESVADALVRKVVGAYQQLAERIGDPRDPANLVGPLIDADARDQYVAAIERIEADGGEILVGGRVLDRSGYYVVPTVVAVPEGKEFPLMDQETFAPILYVRRFGTDDLDGAIAVQNQVEQGLSSAIFTDSVRAAERFWSPAGSDCGIANVNLGTSGAEIGGAFGGEKATGGGRESGSDAWKAYMRRQTCTVNGSNALPLAQGIRWE
ncbi:aldehyde dehydrogenase family protein [Paraliomyxa miuraensis]|uniref:aldehyde dehydrogenase family protein n=1 Tax=Paraliomyxa miuraensis TaxID=376150 RepID=UPI002254189D|nr:aldehyde dehydrogenase family protein [Paraliomyxa miuraensis]MCX4243428.1 aldehyde dehydrogenase family protein [Paraliomyxa miuraensis]